MEEICAFDDTNSGFEDRLKKVNEIEDANRKEVADKEKNGKRILEDPEINGRDDVI